MSCIMAKAGRIPAGIIGLVDQSGADPFAEIIPPGHAQRQVIVQHQCRRDIGDRVTHIRPDAERHPSSRGHFEDSASWMSAAELLAFIAHVTGTVTHLDGIVTAEDMVDFGAMCLWRRGDEVGAMPRDHGIDLGCITCRATARRSSMLSAGTIACASPSISSLLPR